MQRHGKDVKRLFVYFAGIGDAVMYVPLLRRLAADGPLDVLVRDFAGELFAGQSFVSSVWTLKHPNRYRPDWLAALLGVERRRLGRRLAVQGYGEIVVFDIERPHIRRWIETWRGSAAVRSAALHAGHSERVRVSCESLGMDPRGIDANPRIEVSEERRAEMAALLAPLGRVVGFQIGSGPVSKWPRRFDVKGLSPRQWAGFASALLARGDADAIVFQGSAAESPLVREVIAEAEPGVRGRLHDWTGRFGLSDLAALMRCYRALVSVDTGPAHMAAAVGCPLLVLFGPSDPREYLMRGDGPIAMLLGSAPCQFCAGTDAFKRCRNNVCLRTLTSDDLLRAWERLARR